MPPPTADPLSRARQLLESPRLQRLALLAGLLLAALAAYDVFHHLAYEAEGPANVDTLLYGAVGRGILNGVPLYSGLFETKPPVIFALFALSLKLLGSWQLVTAAEVMALFALAAAPLLIVVWEGPVATRLSFRHIAAVLGGALIALYAAARAGEAQVESFGAALLLPWVWAWSGAASAPLVRSRPRLVIGAASLAIAALTKEPFLLVAAAVALVNLRRPGDLFTLLRMALLAGAIATCVLVITGAHKGYFGVYLPEMFLHDAFASHPFDPSRVARVGFDWSRFDDLAEFAPPLEYAVIGATLATMLAQRSAGASWVNIVARFAIALFLCAFAVGMAGRYYHHHFAFIVPWLEAVLVAWLLSSPEGPSLATGWAVATAATVVLLALATLDHPRPNLDLRLARMRSDMAKATSAAEAVDAAATCTGESRYIFIGRHTFQPFGWTKHSPVGPFFCQYAEWFDKDHPQHREELLGQLSGARLLVLDGYSAGEFSATLRGEVERRFRPGLPPACAYIAIREPLSFYWAKE